MKCFAAITLALAALVVANPMPKAHTNHKNPGATKDNSTTPAAAAAAGGNAKDVTAAINSWLQDIKAVNTFVDTAGKLKSDKEISDAAATAFVAAQDEGKQNDALASLTKLDASGKAANIDLANQFAIIGPAINDTISNPKNLQKNLDAINGAR